MTAVWPFVVLLGTAGALLAWLAARQQRLSRELHALGFRFVTLDLDGFRSGSLNELIPLAVRGRFDVTRDAP